MPSSTRGRRLQRQGPVLLGTCTDRIHICDSEKVYDAIKRQTGKECPFVNLPEGEPGRCGQGLTTDKIPECVWIRPEAVADIEFLQCTGADHLRHTNFIEGCSSSKITALKSERSNPRRV